MEKQGLTIAGIPAVLWGAATPKLFIAVHGDQAHKEDAALVLFAEEAAQKGWQTLSFDLLEHGDRKSEARLCNPQNAVEDLPEIMAFARALANDVSLFGCSIGAYFGMLAYPHEPLRQALFLSPVVDMGRIIQNMMRWCDVSEEQLRREGEIKTPVKTLYWSYYQYVMAHPVTWNIPTGLLCGRQDTLCDFKVTQDFSVRFGARLTVMEEGEHYFHTAAQLAFLRRWLGENILN